MTKFDCKYGRSAKASRWTRCNTAFKRRIIIHQFQLCNSSISPGLWACRWVSFLSFLCSVFYFVRLGSLSHHSTAYSRRLDQGTPPRARKLCQAHRHCFFVYMSSRLQTILMTPPPTVGPHAQRPRVVRLSSWSVAIGYFLTRGRRHSPLLSPVQAQGLDVRTHKRDVGCDHGPGWECSVIWGGAPSRVSGSLWLLSGPLSGGIINDGTSRSKPDERLPEWVLCAKVHSAALFIADIHPQGSKFISLGACRIS